MCAPPLSRVMQFDDNRTMKTPTMIALLASSATLVACGKKEEKSQEAPIATEPAASEATPAATKVATTTESEPAKTEEPPATPVDLPPETPEHITAQCAAMLEKNWEAIQPALVKLQIPDPASLKAKYTETGYETRKFLETCPLISQADRKCLTDAADPISASLLCDIDSAKAGGKQFRSPPIPGKSPLLATAPIGKASLKKIAGTWLNKTGTESKTWTISKKGQTKQVVTKSDGTVAPPTKLDEFTLSFTKALEGTRQYPGSNAQTISFFMDSDTTFYSSGNLNYAAYDMKDGKSYVAKMDSDWLFVDGDKCEVVSFQGHVVPATCTSREAEGDSYMDVEYQIPGKGKRRSGELTPDKASFLIVGNHLLPSGLVRLGRYDKQ